MSNGSHNYCFSILLNMTTVTTDVDGKYWDFSHQLLWLIWLIQINYHYY